MKFLSASAFALAYLATSQLAQAQNMPPEAVLNLMNRANEYIANDVETIKTRCGNQQKRKEFLEQEIVRRQPELASVTRTKTALTEELKTKDATLQAKGKALADLRAAIAELQNGIKNANTSTATRLATLRTEREAARKAAADATKNISTLDAEFAKWKDQGSNEFTLYRAQIKDENNKILPPEKRTALTPQEQSALDYLKGYDDMRASLSQSKTTNEAIVAQKDKAIADLSAGNTGTVQSLRERLAAKQAMVPAAVAAVASAQADFDHTRCELRTVTARFATLSNIVIPAIPKVCTVINQVANPQA